jgi:hypothetical protein
MGVNFKCTSCKFCFFVPQYSVSINKEQPIYSTRFGVVECPECRSKAVEYIIKDDICTNIGEYSSASMENKKAMLKRRAKQAMRKDADQRHEIDTMFRGRANEKHY